MTIFGANLSLNSYLDPPQVWRQFDCCIIVGSALFFGACFPCCLILLAGINVSSFFLAVHRSTSSYSTQFNLVKMSEVLSIVGDSNVNRHLNQAKAAHPSDHSLRQSHLITAFNAEQLLSSLTGQNEHRRFVVIAALTNPITNLVFLGGDQLIIDVRLFLQQVSSWIQQGRNFDDGTNSSVFILPPQFRRYPSWYRQFYTNILAIFEDAFRAPSNNVWILPPFMDPEFEADGIHYTPASGLLYVQHLVHSTHLILESPSKPDPVAQSHSSQLQGVRYDISELRFSQMLINAKQEEETNGRLNTEAENQFVIAGLKIARSNSWQERQSSFVNATKELLVRFCPSLAAVSIKFCRK